MWGEKEERQRGSYECSRKGMDKGRVQKPESRVSSVKEKFKDCFTVWGGTPLVDKFRDSSFRTLPSRE